VWSGVYGADDIAKLGVNALDGSTRPRFGGTISPRPESRALCRSLLDQG
jgi:hypothetical protein